MKHVNYKQYSGFKMAGTDPVLPPSSQQATNHMQRSFYLTSQLESPKWGSVQNYDGAAMSGGPMHWVAVYPKTMKQGGLFGLLRAIEIGSSPEAQPYIQRLWDKLLERGWYVATDGKLRSAETGSPISGNAIRNEMTPVAGRVPSATASPHYKQSAEWVELFGLLLAHAGTHEAQKQYSIEYLCRGARGDEMKAYQLFLPKLRYVQQLRADELPEDVELAMAVYHAFSPNAPGKAKSVLKYVTAGGTDDFARRLVRELGTSKYGHWHDTPDNRNRYDRTRIAVTKSQLWPEDLVNDIMPKDFK